MTMRIVKISNNLHCVEIIKFFFGKLKTKRKEEFYERIQ